MSKTEESVFFIVEIEKYIYANTRRFNSGIHYQDLCGVASADVPLPACVDSHVGDMKAVQILVVDNLRIRNKRASCQLPLLRKTFSKCDVIHN